VPLIIDFDRDYGQSLKRRQVGVLVGYEFRGNGIGTEIDPGCFAGDQDFFVRQAILVVFALGFNNISLRKQQY